MPPKKRNAAGSKRNITAAAAKKTACNKTASTKCAGRLPRASPASRVATDASAAKTKAPVRTSSNSSSRRISASPQQAACPPGHGSTVVKITTPSAEGCKSSSSPQPPVTAQAAAARTPAPATRAHRKSSTVKQPPRTDEEPDDGGGVPSSATEEKTGRTCRTDAHANTTVTIASLPIVVPEIDEKESEHEGDDGEDALLFRSGVFDAPSLPPPPQPCTSLVASAVVAVKQNLVTSPEAILSHPPRLLHDRADGRGRSSSATLDLRSCTTPPPPLLQSNVGGAGKQLSCGNTHNADSLRRSSTESSPEALMANSESKPSSHRWQLQLLGGGTPATQRLREGDAFREDSGRHGDSPPAHTAETVKQLFTATARSITITSTSAEDSPNSTLIMSCGSDEDDVEEADPPQPHGRQWQHHERLSPPLNASSITTRSGSEGRWSVGKAACEPTLPPVSATAATPPPLPSLVPRVSSTGGVQLFRGYSSHGSGGVTDVLCCGTSTWLLSTQPSAPKENEAPLSLQSKAVAAVAQSLPAPAGRLRMGGNTSRQGSPSSSYVRLKRTSGGDVVEASHHTAPTPSASSAPLPAHPPCQQQQWLSYASSHLSFTSPSPSQLSRLADMDVVTEADAEAEGGHASITTTPQKRLLREPPVWRSPQMAQLPKSLSVSPVSLRGGSRAGVVKSDAALSLSQPLLHPQHAAHSASPAPSPTGEATQTFTQACTNAAGDAEAAVHVALSGPTAAPAVGRPSTQLITKAAATRPIASPGTMWIFLDDDDYTTDGSDSEDRGRVVEATTAASPHNSSDAPLATVKMETDADPDAVYTSSALTAAATVPPSPSRSPEKGVMAMGDKQGEAPVRLTSRCPSLSKADRTDAGILVSQSSIPVLSAAQARRRLPADKNYPIAEILSPTFRPRRRPPDMSADPSQSLGTGGTIHQRLSSWPVSQCYITLDDDTEDEDADEAPPRQRARNSPALLHASPVARVDVDVYSHLSLPLIIDDDDDDIALEGDGETHTKESREEEGRREGLSPTLPENKRVSRVERASEVAVNEEHSDDLLKSLQKPNVKDFIFPNRLDPELRPSSPLYRSIHAYQQHYQQQLAQGKETEEHDARHVATLALPLQESVKADCRCLPQRSAIPVVAGDTRGTSAANDTVAGQAGHKRSRATDTKTGAAASAPALPDWGRPADMLLRDFFPTKFTKKNFMEAAKNVMSPMHFLEAGDFWAAFASAEFVGEGSFGLVWRCLTVDGDLVAVKSCPIILRTKANIEDSFSTIREIATMRFLNEMRVPYVLPLHSAFFVHAQEALPPLAQEALEWRQKLRKRAEEAALEVEVNLLARGGHRRASNTGADDHVEGMPLTLEQQVAVQLERLVAAEGSEEQATRARLQSVRLPRFLSITHDDLAQSDATVFLVMELCDGDVEGICRSDGIAKGMVYCVSSALAAMHELGLLHLDLKPSNILFAYEHGPSQQRSSATGPPTGAVKFYLSDFGNCRLVGPSPMDEVRDAYGTFEYMDLRALRDAVCGRPTDAFSLGATLYELLYGRRLYPKCVNPRCIGDEDHSRECFVEAASQPVVLPTVGTATTAAMVTLATTDSLNAAAGEHARGPCAKGGTGSSSNILGSGPALTPLQYLALALLQQPWAERMTAEECRRYLVQAFQITQTDDSSP
ncbi:protein kinase, putative [Leishmania tarentolae]|uniref:Protein kinase, putative n=1 Tax=Leishmania tarentolae TaxID=5689 RepID=A0A640KFM4_LEITA|nr:protein kinase, putative [Leishmania tarentolae]